MERIEAAARKNLYPEEQTQEGWISHQEDHRGQKGDTLERGGTVTR